MEAYILGLWLGDKYWRSSSIGLTNTNEVLIAEFRKFLERNGFSRDRIKLSVYTKSGRANRTVTAMKHKIPGRNVKVYKLKKGVNPVFIILEMSGKKWRSIIEKILIFSRLN
jgi:hypothetical protein